MICVIFRFFVFGTLAGDGFVLLQALEEVMELFDIVEACDGLVIAAVMSLFSPRLLPVQSQYFIPHLLYS